MQRGAMRGIAGGEIDGYGFDNFGEQVWRDGNLRTNLPFAPRFAANSSVFLATGHVAALSEESGEAEDEDGLSQNHKISTAERACGVEASEMEQIAAVVNLRRLAHQ
jgi:hypothetical protein